MYRLNLNKTLIFKKVSSDVIKCHQMSEKVVFRWGWNVGEQGESRAKRNMRQEKREAVCMAGEGAGGTNNAEPCRAEGAEAPCLLMASFIFAKRFLWDLYPERYMWDFVGYEICLPQYPIFFIHASRRSQFAPVIVSQIEFGLPPHSFSWKFSTAKPQGKFSRKKCRKCGWQDKFDFPLMKGETVLAISIRLSS